MTMKAGKEAADMERRGRFILGTALIIGGGLSVGVTYALHRPFPYINYIVGFGCIVFGAFRLFQGLTQTDKELP